MSMNNTFSEQSKFNLIQARTLQHEYKKQYALELGPTFYAMTYTGRDEINVKIKSH